MFEFYITLSGIILTWLVTLTVWISRIDSKVSIIWSLFLDLVLGRKIDQYVITSTDIRLRQEVVNKLPIEIKQQLNTLVKKYGKRIRKFRNFEEALLYLAKITYKSIDVDTVLKLSKYLMKIL